MQKFFTKKKLGESTNWFYIVITIGIIFYDLPETIRLKEKLLKKIIFLKPPVSENYRIN